MKNYKFLCSIIFFLIFLMPLSTAQETLKVGIFDNPPKIIIEKNGTVTGLYPVIVEYIAKKEGWKIEYVYGSFRENLEKLKKGEIDMMFDVARTEEREKYMEFNNESMITSYGAFFTNPDFNPTKFKDLDKKTIATMNGSIFLSKEGYPEIEKLEGIQSKIIATPDYETAFILLESKLVDAVIANEEFGVYNKKIHNHTYIKTSLFFLPKENYIAFPKNASLNKILIEKIDANLIELKENKTSIYHKEIYDLFGGYKEESTIIPVWVKVLLISLFLILLIAFIFTAIFLNQNTSLKINKELIEIESKKLTRANKLKDLFIDIMRHDLLNPAGVIKTNVQLALTKEKNKNQKKILTSAYEGSNKLINRINDASLFSKLEENKKIMTFKEINLKNILNGVIEETKELAKKNKIKIESKIKQDFYVNGNPLLHDVFFNLITNAIKYSPKNKKIIIDISKKDKNYLISVTDWGIGIPDKYKKAVFERFKRLEKGAIQGSGLGLAITKKITELHKGKVYVKDNPKGGSIFIVELPILKKLSL